MLTFLKYAAIAVVAVGLMLLFRLLAGNPPLTAGPDYYLSETLMSGMNGLTALSFFMIGLVTGFYTRLHPVWTGVAVVIVPILIIFYETFAFSGSHNLLGIEIATYIIFALPAVVGVYAGRALYNRRVIKKAK